VKEVLLAEERSAMLNNLAVEVAGVESIKNFPISRRALDAAILNYPQ
jgi:hypothetical protein